MFDHPFFVVCVSFVCLLAVFLSSVRGKKLKFCEPFGAFGRPLSNIPLLPGGTRPDFFEPMSQFVGRVLAPKGRPPCRPVPRPFESGGDPQAPLCLFLLVWVCWETGSNRQGKAKQKDQKTRKPPTGYPLVLLVLFGLCLTAASGNRNREQPTRQGQTKGPKNKETPYGLPPCFVGPFWPLPYCR